MSNYSITSNSTVKLIAAIARRLKGEQYTMREAYKEASRRVRIRRGGYASRNWLPGCGENTPLLAPWEPLLKYGIMPRKWQ